jgi:type II secretion system protein I
LKTANRRVPAQLKLAPAHSVAGTQSRYAGAMDPRFRGDDDSARKTRSGFTLLEAVVALFIIGIAAIAALEAVGGELRSHEKVQRTLEAETLADYQLAQTQMLFYEDFVAFPDSLARGRFAEPFDNYSWVTQVEPVVNEENLFRVDLTVSWTGGEYELNTMIYRRPQVIGAVGGGGGNQGGDRGGGGGDRAGGNPGRDGRAGGDARAGGGPRAGGAGPRGGGPGPGRAGPGRGAAPGRGGAAAGTTAGGRTTTTPTTTTPPTTNPPTTTPPTTTTGRGRGGGG